MLKLQFSPQQLCLDLLHADTEEQVIRLLRSQGYWDNPDAWRPFGDRDDNFSTIGNQSGNADAALVEKIVNSVDAVLMGECWSAGIQPNSLDAPATIPGAVAQFLRGDRSRADSLGHIVNWSQQQRRNASHLITLAATGSRGNPSFTIVDAGEGQTPNSMPHTLLSLDKQNKIDVQFVQGKFNMGGTGALRFCGSHNLQLVISRRNPEIKSDRLSDSSYGQWGFTIIRRENPTDSKKVSTYRYLAPEPGGGVSRFDADSMPLFPERNEAYTRQATWGTAIKLYEYDLPGKSHILLPDGLLYRLDLLLPGVALPVRLHECRDFRGHGGSFANTLTGLRVRLGDDRGKNLEQDFPTSGAFTIRGQEMTAEVYAFKRGRADTYRKGEGIVFVVNGQTHGSIPKRFFSRRSVEMNSLEDSILVLVDCSRLDGRTREDLFMNSRDRMEQGSFLRSIEGELTSLIKENQLLRDLRAQRRREDVEKKLQDSKPFKDVLESIIRKSPSLAQLLGRLGPLSDPFKSDKAQKPKEFLGKSHPTYFRFKGMEYGLELKRSTARNMRSRIAFETDVTNDYFTRGQYSGKGAIKSRDNGANNGSLPDYTLNLNNGIATLNMALPSGANVGDSFKYELIVEDDTMVQPFVNPFVVSVGPSQKPSGGNSSPRRPHSSTDNPGSDALQGLAIPTPTLVYESDWDRHGFTKESALKAQYYPPDDQTGNGSYEYYLNMDNVHLKTELKAASGDPAIVKSRWQFGMVLIAMALLNQAEQRPESADAPTPIEEVSRETAVIAPILLPLIEHLGALSAEDVAPDS